MAEKKEGKMLPTEGKPEETCRVLSAFLAELADAGSLRDALEVIKFVRRFVPDRPLTDYRTCGEPLAIREFLKRCGLAQGKDYEMKQSGLDPDSYVLVFDTTDKTKEVLNRIAGLRVEGGPSVCDRLYCELIKDKDRDFAQAMKVGSTGGSDASIAADILDMTEGIYTVCSIADKGKFKREAEIIDWCKAQVKDGKLVPKAPAIAPLAVVEAYCKIGQFVETQDLFELPKVPEESVVSRPIDLVWAKIPLGFCSKLPLPILRTISKRFNAYVAADAATFAEAAGHADSAYVRVDARFDLAKDEPQQTFETCRYALDSLKLFKYVRSLYEAAYRGMVVSFDSNSCARTPVGYGENAKRIEQRRADGLHSGNQVEFLTEECDKLAGFEPTDENPCVSVFAGFVLAPYKSVQPPEQLFDDRFGPSSVSSVIIEDTEEDGKMAELKSELARLWFETVHGKAPDKFKDEELKDKLPKFLKDLNNDPKSVAEKVKAKCAATIRTWIETHVGSCDESFCTFVANEAPDGLHSPDSFCTQVISTVTSGTKSLSSWTKDIEGGSKAVAPNLVFGRPEEKELFTGFIDLSATTDVQVRSPKKAETFMVVVETNFTDRFSDGQFPCSLRDPLKNALVEALVSGRESALDKAKRKLPSNALAQVIGEMTAGYGASGKIGRKIQVGYKLDKHNRIAIIYTIEADAALSFILGASAEDRTETLLRLAVESDPGVIRLPKEGWRKELLTRLLTTGGYPLPCYSRAFEEYIGTNGDNMLETYGAASMFDRNTPTPPFRSRLTVTKAPIDPN